jgi:hypothetical protein
LNSLAMKRIGLVGLALLCAAATAGAQQPPASKGEIPAEYKPPKGMCRIWLKDVPPKQQPAPTDCPSAINKVPPNGHVIYGDIDDKKEKPKDPPGGAKGYTGKGNPPPVVVKKPPTVR